MDKRTKVRLSVRVLVEFILRSGNIDNRRTTALHIDAMQKGSNIHKKLQRSMGSRYRSEVPLAICKEYPDCAILVEGRADGVVDDGLCPLIDEIKGVYLNLKRLYEPVPTHLAQAKCYAYMFIRDLKKPGCTVQLTYCNLKSEQIKRFDFEYTFEELEAWFTNLMDEYHKWVSYRINWMNERNESISCLTFPFEYREGQKRIVSALYHTFCEKKEIFVQAPTGVGKTMASIYPAIRAVGEGRGDKIFYLTARNVARSVAWNAYSTLSEHGLKYKVLILTAKEKICPIETCDCNPSVCEMALGHFDKINDAVFSLLTTEDYYDCGVILEYAQKYKVCPYELSLDLSLWVDAVICDYNYLFDPDASLRRFFGVGTKSTGIILVDEAHNLVSRARDMYSADICKEDIDEMLELVQTYAENLDRLTDALQKFEQCMLRLKRQCPDVRILESMESFYTPLVNLNTELEKNIESVEYAHDMMFRHAYLDFYFSVRTFLSICQKVNNRYVIYTELSDKFYIHVFCVDPSENVQSCIDKGASAVFFSATLTPIEYYISSLSAGSCDYTLKVESPFSVSKRAIFIARDVSTLYDRRTADMYEIIARYIDTVTGAKDGNYMVFFPSYDMLCQVLEIYKAHKEDSHIITQKPNMDEASRILFLENFNQKPDKTLIGFCVMGGVFSEGIDLPGERLIGAIIIGVGLPKINVRSQLIKEYYDRRCQKGFDYAYRYPGINKVLQSAGRVIRTKDDVGVIVLLDNRLILNKYRNLLPEEWSDAHICTIEGIGKSLHDFWEHV